MGGSKRDRHHKGEGNLGKELRVRRADDGSSRELGQCNTMGAGLMMTGQSGQPARAISVSMAILL